MRSYCNIEKSAFRTRQYVGYSVGVWCIVKSNSSYGSWHARKQDSSNEQLFAFTLASMSQKLTDYQNNYFRKAGLKS